MMLFLLLEVVHQRAITALQRISLTVAPGQTSSAPMARDKSTLLRAISCFHSIDDAEVTDGNRCLQRKAHRDAKLGIALVPEREKALANLTVAENLAVPAAARVAR
jgi:ABC-type branched-subunit amino acid transport system ATPase component